VLVNIADRVEKRRSTYIYLQGGKTYIKNECERNKLRFFLASTLLIMIKLIKHNLFAHHDNFNLSNIFAKCEHILDNNQKKIVLLNIYHQIRQSCKELQTFICKMDIANSNKINLRTR